MRTQRRNELNQSDADRRRISGGRSAARVDSARQPAIDCPALKTDDAGRGESLFSIMTMLAVIALAACGASAIAATYGPVFTQATIGP
jgi:hypothetical protein